ncbi:MAG: class II aldolase/adducin family protein, partial [Clostridiales bacterium]|nr:class II aldolase/adducin family protein [Clostridiales bacterium]
MYYSETEARKLVIEAGHRLLENKLIARTWGNISARISKEEFIITPSGKAYDRLSPSDLVKVRISDLSYTGSIKPSSEKGVHAAAYSLRSHVGFIIHTHQYYASAVAAECRSISSAPCASYALPGTAKLRRNVEACIKSNPY